MNAFPSDTIYRSQLARNQELLSEAATARHARSARYGSGLYDSATRLIVFALRRQPAPATVVTHRVAAAE
jgi:hypothetical protein